MKVRKSLLIGLTGLGLAAVAAVGCSGSSGGGGGSSTAALSISGGFSSLSFVSLSKNGEVRQMAATDYTMVCAMLVSPFTSDAKALAADGSFSLSISGGSGQPIGCFLTKAGAIAGVFEFQADSGDGGSALPVNSGASQISFPSDMALGNDGVVTVPVANITQNSSTAPSVTWADPTGTWNITKACLQEINETTGKLESTCMNPSETGGKIPSSVYLKVVSATNGTDTKSGLAIWASQAARTACGDVEGDVDLPSGYTAVGGWDSAFTGGVTLNLSTTGNVDTAATYAVADTWGGSTTVCNATVASPGTTKCSEVTWTGQGSQWGMSDAACKLYCVLGAVQRGNSDEGNFFDWAGYKGSAVSCTKRYRMNWQYGNEFSDDKDYDSNNGSQAGSLNDGACNAGGDGCFETGMEILVPDDRGPEERFMFDLLTVAGNVGTVITKENTGKHNYKSNDGLSVHECGGTRVEKLTMVQTSASAAQVTVENTFVPDKDNDAGCATNDDFKENGSDTEGFVLQLSK